MTRLTRILIAVVAAGAALVLTVSVNAEPNPSCARRPAVVDGLKRNFAEVPIAVGLQSDGSVMEIFASAKTGSWTIVVTRPNGTSCAVADGENIEVRAVSSGESPR